MGICALGSGASAKGAKARNSATGSFILGLNNDEVGYMGTERAYEEGSYQVEPGGFGLVDRSAARVLHETAVELARRLQEPDSRPT